MTLKQQYSPGVQVILPITMASGLGSMADRLTPLSINLGLKKIKISVFSTFQLPYFRFVHIGANLTHVMANSDTPVLYETDAYV